MFTLKFMKFFDDGTHIENCLRCPHYEARKTPAGDWSVIIYPSMTTTEGVEWWVRKRHADDEPLSHDTCFVENENGKTIAKYHIPIGGS